jgi:hypothetical protein
MRNLNIALFLRQALKPVEPINIVFGPFVLITVNQRIIERLSLEKSPSPVAIMVWGMFRTVRRARRSREECGDSPARLRGWSGQVQASEND